MKKVIVGVFAHPDDEAFGPAGTLIEEIKRGAEVHLISLTAGEAGANPDNVPDLGVTRLEEWRKAGEIIGAASMTHLGYKDSELSNSDLLPIADHVQTKLLEFLTIEDVSEIEIMSFELGGISGHIDHIVAARAACTAFYRLKPSQPRLTRMRLFCLPKSWQQEPDVSWVFMDQGHDDEVLEKVDVGGCFEQRTAAINAHHSQRHDGEQLLARCKDGGDAAHFDYFVVRT